MSETKRYLKKCECASIRAILEFMRIKYTINICVVTVIAAFVLSQPVFADSHDKDLYHKGVLFALQGRFELAKELFGKALEADHPFESPLKSSLSLIEDVMRNKIRKVAAQHYFKATYLAERGEFNNAISEFNKAIAQQPQYPMFYNARGVLWGVRRFYDKALRDFNYTLSLEPNYYKAYLNRASIYTNQGLLEEALSDLDHALSIFARYPEAFLNRGMIYARKERFIEAIGDFTKAITLYSKYTLAYFHRANAYAHQKQYELALADFNKVIELDPKLIEVYFNKALAFEHLEKPAEAVENYKIFIALAPPKLKKLAAGAQEKVEALEKALHSGSTE